MKQEENKNLDEKIKKLLNDSEKEREESYRQAKKRLVRKDKDFERLITEDDIQKLATYQDQDILNRVEIKAIQQERKKMLQEEKENLANGLSKKVGQGMENSIEYSNAVIKAVLLGLFGGPVGIAIMTCKELVSAEITKKEIKEAILESIESGNESNVHNLIAEKDREYGKVLNFSGFLDYIKKSDIFHDLLTNEQEKKKILESMEHAERESFEMFKELEDFKDEELLKKEQEKFEEDEEDPEPEIGVRTLS